MVSEIDQRDSCCVFTLRRGWSTPTIPEHITVGEVNVWHLDSTVCTVLQKLPHQKIDVSLVTHMANNGMQQSRSGHSDDSTPRKQQV